MNSIQRVKAAIHFTGPDRVPVFLAGLADVAPMMMIPPRSWRPGHAAHEEGLFPYVSDAEVVRFGLWRWRRPDWAAGGEFRKWLSLPRREVDEWGVIWAKDPAAASIGHPVGAALPDWSGYEEYIGRYHPDPADPTRYRFFARLYQLVARRRYRMAILGDLGPFSTAANIRGFNDFLVDHRKHPERLRRLLSRITDFYLGAIEGWVASGADPHGFMLYDDLADQQRPFMSPALFAEFYGPVYRPIIERAHAGGCEVHLHCCGKIDPLIPILIDWGLDALELDSPRMTGYESLAPFRGKIMMWGCVNIQSIYPLGTAAECEREVWHMVRNLGTKDGGFGAYFYPQPSHIGVGRENIRAFRRGLGRYGVYGKIPPSWWDLPVAGQWRDDTVPPAPLLTDSP
jgi:uroporphyrinogen decarboxylase